MVQKKFTSEVQFSSAFDYGRVRVQSFPRAQLPAETTFASCPGYGFVMQGNVSLSRIRRIAAAFVFIHILAVRSAEAQSSLSGDVVEDRGAAIEMANVQLLRGADSTLIAGTITNPAGAFLFESVEQGTTVSTSPSSGLLITCRLPSRSTAFPMSCALRIGRCD